MDRTRIKFRVTPKAFDLISIRFDELDDYNTFMKAAIKQEQKKTSSRMKKATRGLSKKEKESYYDFFGEDYFRITEFEHHALESFAVMLYSLIEAGMGNLCDAIRQDRQVIHDEKISLRYTDIMGRGNLDQAKLYMEKVLGIDLDLGNNPQWPEIVALRILRNSIVHEEGWLKTKDTILKRHIANGFMELRTRGNGTKEEVTGHVKVNSSYIDYILPQCRLFFETIKIER